MALYSWATGDLITSTRLNGGYNLLKGVAGGTDTVSFINGTTFDLTGVDTTSGFKLPATAGAVPTADGTFSFDTTTHIPQFGSNGSTVPVTGTTSTQTLTNKTLTSPTIGGSVTLSTGVKGTGTASATVGAIQFISSNTIAVGMATMFSNLSANNVANAVELGFSMNNSTPAEVQFGGIRVTSSTVTAGAEQGTMILRTKDAGTMVTHLSLNNLGAQITGTLGIGAAPVVQRGVSIPNSVTLVSSGNSGFGAWSDPLFDSNTTSQAVAVYGQGKTTAASYTITKSAAFYAGNPALGAGSAITTVAALEMEAMSSGGTNWGIRDASFNNHLMGPIFLGSTSTNNKFSTASSGAGTTAMLIGNATITVVSDKRIKDDIQPYSGDAIGLIKALKVVDFVYKEANRPFGGYEGRSVGFIAQDLNKVAPWAVHTQGGADCEACLDGEPCDEHPIWMARYEFLIGPMVKAMQDMNARLVRAGL